MLVDATPRGWFLSHGFFAVGLVEYPGDEDDEQSNGTRPKELHIIYCHRSNDSKSPQNELYELDDANEQIDGKRNHGGN